MKFPIVYVDPAWTYRDRALAGDRGAGCKYHLMTQDDLEALEVESIAEQNSCLLMWATMPKLPDALTLGAMWGFTYKTCAFTWVKRCGTGSWLKGMGRYTRANAELVLLFTRGKPLARRSMGVSSVIEALRGRHSAKPPETRDRIVSLFGDIPRVELFARETCPGWTSLGYDIDGRDLRQSVPALARATGSAT